MVNMIEWWIVSVNWVWSKQLECDTASLRAISVLCGQVLSMCCSVLFYVIGKFCEVTSFLSCIEQKIHRYING